MPSLPPTAWFHVPFLFVQEFPQPQAEQPLSFLDAVPSVLVEWVVWKKSDITLLGAQDKRITWTPFLCAESTDEIAKLILTIIIAFVDISVDTVQCDP